MAQGPQVSLTALGRIVVQVRGRQAERERL